MMDYSSFVQLYSFSLISVFFVVFTMNWVEGFSPLTNECEFDGFYTCQQSTSADYEVPSSSATNWHFGDTGFNSPQISLPFTLQAFNFTTGGSVFFDSDLTVRLYEPYVALAAGMSSVIVPTTGSVKSFEILGNDTITRRAVFTWASFVNSNLLGSNFSVQIKIFQSGNIEYHYKNMSVGPSDSILVGLEYSDSNGNYRGDFPVYLQSSLTLTNVAYGFMIAPACGDACVPRPPIVIQHLTPAQFCALQTWNPTYLGYFCQSTTSFYLCFAGDLTIYSLAMACAGGTQCSCPTGVECSQDNTVSPCGF